MSTPSPSSPNQSLTTPSTHTSLSFGPVGEIRMVLQTKEAEEGREGKGVGIIDISQISQISFELKPSESEPEKPVNVQSEIEKIKAQLDAHLVEFKQLKKELELLKSQEEKQQKRQQDIYDAEFKRLGIDVTTNSTELHANLKELGPLAIEAISHSQKLTNLTKLTLPSYLGADAAKALAGSTTLTNLTHLYLSSSNIGDDGAKALAASTKLTNLTHLHLNSSNIGDDGAKALAESTTLTNLTHLHLRNNKIDRSTQQDIKNSKPSLTLSF